MPGPVHSSADYCVKPNGSNIHSNCTWMQKAEGSCHCQCLYRTVAYGAKGTTDGQGFQRVLDCAVCWSPGWEHVQAAFHICCLHMGNLTLLLSHGGIEGPKEMFSHCSRWQTLLPAAFLTCHPLPSLFFPPNVLSFPITSYLLCFLFNCELIQRIQQQLYNL